MIAPHRLIASVSLTLLIGPSAAAVVTTHEAGTGVTIFSNVAARPVAVMVTGTVQSAHAHTLTQPRDHVAASSIAPTFPRIAVADQLARDTDRKKILQDELATELQALQAAAARGEAADVVHRHESNVAALRREVAGLH